MVLGIHWGSSKVSPISKGILIHILLYSVIKYPGYLSFVNLVIGKKNEGK